MESEGRVVAAVNVSFAVKIPFVRSIPFTGWLPYVVWSFLFAGEWGFVNETEGTFLHPLTPTPQAIQIPSIRSYFCGIFEDKFGVLYSLRGGVYRFRFL